MRRPASVRGRVTLLATLVVLLVLVVTSKTLVDAQRRTLTNRVDDGLALDLRGFAAAVRQPLIDSGAAPGSALKGMTTITEDDGIVQVVDRSGIVLAESVLGSRLPTLQRAVAALGLRAAFNVRFNGIKYRVRSTSLGSVAVATAEPVDDIDASVAALGHSLALAVPIVGTMLAALVWWVVGRALRPVESLRAEVASISGADLHRRVPEPSSRDEITRLARTMNAMLERIDVATASQQRFVADASHELRSPLTRMRTELEVDLAATAPSVETHRVVLAEVVGMQQLVDDLLAVARQASARTWEPVDLDDVVLDRVARHRIASPVPINTTEVSAAQVTGDGAALGRLVGNLLDNASRHATTTVSVSVREEQTWAVVTVTDDGPGIPSDQAEVVFGRFTRLDEARSSVDGGSGLGLAIARRIAEDHGGTLALDATVTSGARLVLRLPMPRG